MVHNRRVRSAPSLTAALVVLTLASPSGGSGLPEPGTWIPSTASFVAFADLGTLLSSPALEALETLLARRISPDQLDTFRELTGMDPWRDFHALSLFIGDAPESNEGTPGRELWGVAISGGFDPERILHSIERRLHVERREHRETPLYVFFPGQIPGAPTGDLESHALAFPDGSTALFGSADSVRLMLDVGLGFAPSSSGSRLQLDLDELSGCDALCLVGLGSAGIEASRRRPLGERSEMPALRSYALSVRTGTEIRVRARAEADSPKGAGEIADLVRGVIALGALSPQSVSSTPALESVEIETIDERVEFSFEVDSRSLRQWLRDREKAEASKSIPR